MKYEKKIVFDFCLAGDNHQGSIDVSLDLPENHAERLATLPAREIARLVLSSIEGGADVEGMSPTTVQMIAPRPTEFELLIGDGKLRITDGFRLERV